MRLQLSGKYISITYPMVPNHSLMKLYSIILFIPQIPSSRPLIAWLTATPPVSVLLRQPFISPTSSSTKISLLSFQVIIPLEFQKYLLLPTVVEVFREEHVQSVAQQAHAPNVSIQIIIFWATLALSLAQPAFMSELRPKLVYLSVFLALSLIIFN